MRGNLTQGNVYKKIIVFSIPILLSNLLQQLFGIVDSMIVGKLLGKDALAAVGASYQIIIIILAVAMGLTLGMGILISDAYGGKREAEIQRIVDTGLCVCLALAMVITLFGIIFADNILSLFHVPEDIFEEAVLYFQGICIGTVSSFGYNAIANYLRGIGDSKTEFYFLIVSSVINIGLDFLLIEMTHSVLGAAIATSVSQTVAFAGLIICVRRRKNVFTIRFSQISFDQKLLMRGLKIGIPATLQQLFIGVGNSFIQSMINGYGATVIAAYTAASKIDGMAVLPAVNIGKAMSNVIAQNRGAGNKKRVKEAIKAGIIMVAVLSVCFSIIIFVVSGNALNLFCADKMVHFEGVRYLKIVCSFYLFFGIMQVLNGILLGLGKSSQSLIGSVVSFCAFQVPLAIVLSHYFGVIGIWFAAPCGWIAGMVIRIGFVWKNGKVKRDGE